jgi:hypothetical protein
VLPLPHRLMRYTQKASDLDLSKLTVDAGKAKMIPQCPGSRRRSLLHSPMRRYQWKMREKLSDYKYPTERTLAAAA